MGWFREAVNTAASPAGSDAAATTNGASINIAVFGAGGDLDFYWEDNSGYNKEVVAPVGAN
jgi:hypothetical protein